MNGKHQVHGLSHVCWWQNTDSAIYASPFVSAGRRKNSIGRPLMVEERCQRGGQTEQRFMELPSAAATIGQLRRREQWRRRTRKQLGRFSHIYWPTSPPPPVSLARAPHSNCLRMQRRRRNCTSLLQGGEYLLVGPIFVSSWIILNLNRWSVKFGGA